VEQNCFCEANCSSGSQEITGILWKSTVFLALSKEPALGPILTHIDQIHAPILFLADSF